MDDKGKKGGACIRWETWSSRDTARYHQGECRITKPDTDNLQKLLKDCMTAAGFWKGDCLVASEIVEKFWSEILGIYIRIEEL